MSHATGSIRCAACQFEFSTDNELTECPGCGATIYQAKVVETIEAYDGHKALGVRAGMSRTKGWFVRSESIPKPQVSRGGAMARVDRVYDRDNDRYKEKVVDCKTGELIHEDEEKLSEHRGHGSDKPNK